jgi:hypothetical protein
MPSMAETPVWMNSSGYSRAVGLIAAPTMSRRSSGTISGHLQRLAQEADGRVAVDALGSLEDLDGDQVRLGFEHLAAPDAAVLQFYLDDLVVADGFVGLDEHQRAADLGDCLVLFHFSTAP